ncbi:YceD family protein [Cronbergia sp. UHCC 0137]|uniref:YceD family protein n=1 Tax=Cronbergia sp. UHCC 0137 TaxID=3110239 RepID=UPI002B1FF0F5|nr:YceD family protein [Cronbergia sp. UHCC 0137]MEA5618167.1 YceD family protein [Cronbergia sp. UHCC 0137]
MDAIFIPQLIQAPERTEEIQVNEFLPDLETLTPVRGVVRVQHQGTYLDVSGQAETIITCTCNRCLQQYNQRLAVNTQEIIWLDRNANQAEDLPLEREVVIEDLVETLSPDGDFHPGDWLYEQMCLAIPHRQLCDRNCPGIINAVAGIVEETIDSRWASLQNLKKQLPDL